jgi:two-component system, sensor histidine kinase and response regulator
MMSAVILTAPPTRQGTMQASQLSTILIIDDTPANVRVVAEYLGSHGYTDLILLDVMMPGWDGFETCRRLRADPATSAIPVIFMTALSDINDKIRAYDAGGVDYVTKPFHAEEVLARVTTHLNLRATQRQLLERSEELARSNAELERMAYVASHDLQEPLRMVASYVQLLERRYKGRLDAEADEFIAFAVEGASRMQALIEDLLTMSRVDTKARPLQRIDCNDVAAMALAALRVAIEESGAQVRCGDLPCVLGDAGQLSQVFQNLIANAIKFCKDRPPRVDISAQRDGRYWRIAVSDNGIGIAPEHRQRIFEMFQRLHAGHEYPGTGIGLAICKKIVERHGGVIGVAPGEQGGSVFTLTLAADEQEVL